MKPYRVELHHKVERDVQRIAGFLLQYTTQESVISKINQIDRDLLALAENPFKGMRHEDIVRGLRAIPSAGKGVITFQIIEDQRLVRVLAISWAGSDWQGEARRRT